MLVSWSGGEVQMSVSLSSSHQNVLGYSILTPSEWDLKQAVSGFFI